MSFWATSKVPIESMPLFSSLAEIRGITVVKMEHAEAIRNGLKKTHRLMIADKAEAWVVRDKSGKSFLYCDTDRSYSKFARKQIRDGMTIMQEYTLCKLKSAMAGRTLRIQAQNVVDNRLILKVA